MVHRFTALRAISARRAGVQRYRVFTQSISRLPIPDAPTADRDAIAALALAITEQARARYTLHRQTRHRILTDLGPPGAALNQKLTAWWELDFAGFLAEVRKVSKREIPLRQRDDWEGWLASQLSEHEAAHRRDRPAGDAALRAALRLVRSDAGGNQAHRGEHEVPVRRSVSFRVVVRPADRPGGRPSTG